MQSNGIDIILLIINIGIFFIALFFKIFNKTIKK